MKSVRFLNFSGYKIKITFLFILGISQMVGDLFQIPALKGLSKATCASILPKVFCAQDGLETFSSRFYFESEKTSIKLTNVLYAQLKGPYNRRNAFGACIAYGPLLQKNFQTKPLLESVVNYYLSPEKSDLLSEMGFQKQSKSWIRIESESPTFTTTILEPTCK